MRFTKFSAFRETTPLIKIDVINCEDLANIGGRGSRHSIFSSKRKKVKRFSPPD